LHFLGVYFYSTRAFTFFLHARAPVSLFISAPFSRSAGFLYHFVSRSFRIVLVLVTLSSLVIGTIVLTELLFFFSSMLLPSFPQYAWLWVDARSNLPFHMERSLAHGVLTLRPPSKTHAEPSNRLTHNHPTYHLTHASTSSHLLCWQPADVARESRICTRPRSPVHATHTNFQLPRFHLPTTWVLWMCVAPFASAVSVLPCLSLDLAYRSPRALHAVGYMGNLIRQTPCRWRIYAFCLICLSAPRLCVWHRLTLWSCMSGHDRFSLMDGYCP
jgi:hypothetical protein